MHLSGIENCSPNGLFGTLKAKKLFMSQRVGPFCHLTWAISTQILLYAAVLYRVIDYKLSISYIEKLLKRIQVKVYLIKALSCTIVEHLFFYTQGFLPNIASFILKMYFVFKCNYAELRDFHNSKCVTKAGFNQLPNQIVYLRTLQMSSRGSFGHSF